MKKRDRERILIVDDDDDVREALIDELCTLYEVEAAPSGEDAIQRLREGDFDAVISDLRMPGMDGVQVLEHVHKESPETVRILLTGYLDEQAREATLKPDAPFKIGKPWHDEVEVTLRRAFEQRDIRNRLESSVVDALAVAGIDDELAAADGVAEVSQVLVRRALDVHGVESCGVILDVCGRERVLAGHVGFYDEDDIGFDDWTLDESLTADGATRVRARGIGEKTHEIVSFMVKRARRWSEEDTTTRLARRATADPEARERLSAVSRRATLGAMTASLVHELASVVQSMQGSLHELDFLARERLQDDAEAIECLDNANETARRILSLFRAMRSFVRSGNRNLRVVKVEDLISRAVALCAGYIRAHGTLRIGEIPDADIEVNEPLFLQVVVNLLRNAADASPRDGFIDLQIDVAHGMLELQVTDDGGGVPADQEDTLFEPFFTSKEDSLASGLGLAIAAEIVREHGGTIRHETTDDRGARFVVSMPLAATGEDRPAPATA